MSADSLIPGSHYGAWTLVRPLGSGGMGAVWLAQRDGEQGALKISFELEPSSCERFYRERTLLWRLRSPRVVRLLDWGETPIPWYVMELVSGLSLDELLQDGPLPPEKLRWILEELAGALSDMHHLRLAHRDLKPANIMVADAVVKVIDLGLGQHETDPRLTRTGFCSGSLGYLPPEAIDGVFDPFRTDLYALGIVLAEMMVGRWVFGSAKALTRWQFSGTPLRLPGPRWLSDLVTDLTHPDLRRRICRMEEVNERIFWAERRVVHSRSLCFVGPSEASRVLAYLESR